MTSNLTRPTQDMKDLLLSLQANARDLTPDLTFVCEQGETALSQMSLLQLSSPFLRQVLDTLPPSTSATLILPDVSKVDLEKVVALLSWETEDWIVTSDQTEVVTLLGIPVGKPEEILIPRQDDSQDFVSNSISENNDPEDTTEENIVPNEENIVSNEENILPKCLHCETNFEDRSTDSIEEMRFHVAEAHFESDLLLENLRLFQNSNKCGECKENIEGEYVQKEHIILKHPWEMLTSTVNAIISNVNPVVDESQQERNSEHAAESEYPHDSPQTDTIVNNIVNKFFPEYKEKPIEQIIKETLSNQDNTETDTIVAKGTNNNNDKSKSTLKCSLCNQNWNSSGYKMNILKFKVKMHLCFEHFGEKLTELQQQHYSAKSDQCSQCSKKIVNVKKQKEHLVNQHKMLKDRIDSHIYNIMGNLDSDSPNKVVEPAKRKASESRDSPAKKSKPEDVSDPAEDLRTQSYLDLIQSSIVFSDSEGEDEDEKMQSKIEFSDSSDDE